MAGPDEQWREKAGLPAGMKGGKVGGLLSRPLVNKASIVLLLGGRAGDTANFGLHGPGAPTPERPLQRGVREEAHPLTFLRGCSRSMLFLRSFLMAGHMAV